MSARLFKIFSGTFLVHIVVLSVVWVGFSTPAPRPPATFTYEGALPADDAGSGAGENPFGREGIGTPPSDQFLLDHMDASYLNNWTALRGPSK